MLPLSDIKPGQLVVGLHPSAVATVAAVSAFSPTSVKVIYELPDGSVTSRLLGPADEPTLRLAVAERPWAFDGDGAAFKLCCEAKRMDLAFLFDPMMAVHTSAVEPLPHQITAVYEAMLPRQPLRYVLADDPGAGKTVMAGLYLRELLLRADARRVLVVAPGGLVEQWKEELATKFGLDFPVYSPALDQSAVGEDAFAAHPQLIVRLDQLARNDDLRDRACRSGWDLVVFDEAHKLAAHHGPGGVKKTHRFEAAEALGRHTRHLLLMTATPHNGKEEDFQLFLSLLDGDRFYGKFRDKAKPTDATDLMRRMVKEQLVRFDGTPLFPERRAYTVNYTLSPAERGLYEAVTRYVQTEMGKADAVGGARKGSVGFALTALQRRLASSPAAIHQSIRRRKERLAARLNDLRLGRTPDDPTGSPPDDDDDLAGGEQEELEETLIERATAARTEAELAAEILLLADLERQAQAVVASGLDRKWDELSKLVQHDPRMVAPGGGRRKLIIFTEHRDTLAYLADRIAGVIGSAAAVRTIHGGTPRDARRLAQEEFRQQADVLVLVATDAAGEGVNLQCAHLMVNYDLPWNPNRLEQRFGRIHRINQSQACHLWNLVAKETREGAVYHRLLQKLQVESAALNGRVFDVLGEVFEERSLKDLLLEAIKFNGQPERQQFLLTKMDAALDDGHLKALLDRHALAAEALTPDRLFQVKDDMDRAEARRLQPHYVRAFFETAFEAVGGVLHPRSQGRAEITHVPAAVRERSRWLVGRNPRHRQPVVSKYSRVCFSKEEAVRPGPEQAELLHPGHPLVMTVTDMTLDRHADLLRRGATLIDPADPAADPWVLALLLHEIKDGAGQSLSRRLQFVRLHPDDATTFAGYAPHLDLLPMPAADLPLLADALAAPWLAAGLEGRAVAWAAAELAPDHFREVSDRRTAHIDKTHAEVHRRLTQEIDFQSNRYIRLSDDLRAGKDVRLNLDQARKSVEDLQARLTARKAELLAQRHVESGPPVLLGAALVVPAGLVGLLRGDGPAWTAADVAARRRVERLAVAAVTAAEQARGCHVTDVQAAKCGWDLTSHPPAVNGVHPEVRHIEVKGRAAGATTTTVTANEILYAYNQGDKFLLALVFVNPDDTTDGPHYVRRPFDREPGPGEVSVNYSVPHLLARATPQ